MEVKIKLDAKLYRFCINFALEQTESHGVNEIVSPSIYIVSLLTLSSKKIH